MEYGQFCPIAKALEIIGEKWTVLVVRELLMGGCRFNELQRGLSLISPTILNKRLISLAEYGLVVKKKLPGQDSYAYYPTEACKQLLPIIKSLGDWGMRWARDGLNERDLDVGLLMLYLERSVRPDKLIGGQTVIHFKFTDVANVADWWIVATQSTQVNPQHGLKLMCLCGLGREGRGFDSPGRCRKVFLAIKLRSSQSALPQSLPSNSSGVTGLSAERA